MSAVVRKEPVSDSPALCFEEIDTGNYYSEALARLNIDPAEPAFVKSFVDALAGASNVSSPNQSKIIASELTSGFPSLLQKLNLLQFCKKYKKNVAENALLMLAKKIRSNAKELKERQRVAKSSYATAYGHWAADLFAQLCRESRKNEGVPYAGFDTFVKMSCGNPRNLLIVLGRAYEIAAFKEVGFLHGAKLPVAMQTEAAVEAARFMYERDTNYGSQSERAREAVSRLAQLLRTARYAMNIPEVSPLAVSFYDAELTGDAKQTLDSALNYSFVFEIRDGRPDRNSERLNRKIQLNPLLSPRWGLPISVRGDISLPPNMANAIFDPSRQAEFEVLLKNLNWKWNNPFAVRTRPLVPQQEALPL
jgi:hypothetical protein